MPEQRQIGRGPAIDLLEHKLESAVHQWLIGERRIGKTSTAKAALARLRKKDAIALDLDLSKLEIETSNDLAAEIARQAQAARAGGDGATRRILGGLRKQSHRHGPKLSKTLKELGFEDESQALGAVAALLAGADDGSPGLGTVLNALALQASASGRRVVILLDEVHLLEDLPEADKEIARWCRELDSPVVFAFAGSEESAVRALRGAGRPLEVVGEEFHLLPIASSDWLHGLRDRFAEAEVEIEEKELYEILDASDGHPRRTMLIASRVHTAALAHPDRLANDTLVALAIQDARRDRAWT
jgi:hypothetical protein